MNWNRSPAWRRAAAGVMCVVVLALAGCNKFGKQAEMPPAQPVEGKPFPALVVEEGGGDVLAARGFQGKVLVLNVWATWCPPCRREMPSLERLSRTLDPNRFAVIGMSTDHDERLAAEFLHQNGITFANFYDRNGKLAKQFGMKVYPETFLIAPDGLLIQRIPGLREWDSADILAELEAAYQQHQKRGNKRVSQ